MPVSKRVDKLVSQSTAGSQSKGGDNAQKVPARLAARAPNIRLARCIIAATVSTANNVSIVMIASAEPLL
jgi:hypothetical protein